MTIAITDVVLRDAHQSLFATRLRLDDMLPIAAQLDDVGYGSLECWGGATFDACIRFLGEDPWVRLRELKKAMPKTPLQMLLRGQNLLGYRHYADDVVARFVERAVKNGMDVFRVFDAMNDPRNMKAALQAVRSHGAHAQGTLSYTTSPAHTLQTWLDLTEQLLETGVDSIAIKDMSGILTPMAAYELVSEIKKRFEVRLHLHCHATTGMAEMALLKAIEAGVDGVDTAISSMSATYGHPATEALVATLAGTEHDTGLDILKLENIAAYFREVRKKYHAFEGQLKGYTPGVLALFYKVAIGSGVAPLVIFMGVGAMTDFGPLLANPRTLLLGAAAQFGIFATVLGALTLNYFGLIAFTLPQAAAIGIIGGADGPTAIYLSGKLAPELLGAIAVAAYSYMALVPLIQPPIMKALTTETERKIRMVQLRTVSKREKILFPVVLLMLVALLLPDAAPLLGMFCFGNLMRESGVVERLSDTVQNGLINIVTIFLGLSVGAKLVADKFLQPQTLGILLLGVIAFGIGTAAGVLMAKLMNLCSKNKINPLIGSAGVSAVPMAARVSNKVGLESDAQNFLLMHAMGPNVAGVIGSAIAAGVMLKYVLAM
ncbi:sodium ion-translocating decarboxylase subunit beta [Salmonella enterica]